MITIMIKRAERENIDEIKRLWKVCFPDVDERYQDLLQRLTKVEENLINTQKRVEEIIISEYG